MSHATPQWCNCRIAMGSICSISTAGRSTSRPNDLTTYLRLHPRPPNLVILSCMKPRVALGIVVTALLLLVACGPANPTAGSNKRATASAETAVETESAVESEQPVNRAASDAVGTPDAAPQEAPAIPDTQVARYLDDLAGDSPAKIEEALNTISESGDTRFVSVLDRTHARPADRHRRVAPTATILRRLKS